MAAVRVQRYADYGHLGRRAVIVNGGGYDPVDDVVFQDDGPDVVGKLVVCDADEKVHVFTQGG